jgi:hypothetical protein
VNPAWGKRGPVRSPSSALVPPNALEGPPKNIIASLPPVPRPSRHQSILLQIPSTQLYISPHEPRSRLHRSFHLSRHPLSRPYSCQVRAPKLLLNAILSIDQRPNQLSREPSQFLNKHGGPSNFFLQSPSQSSEGVKLRSGQAESSHHWRQFLSTSTRVLPETQLRPTQHPNFEERVQQAQSDTVWYKT